MTHRAIADKLRTIHADPPQPRRVALCRMAADSPWVVAEPAVGDHYTVGLERLPPPNEPCDAPACAARLEAARARRESDDRAQEVIDWIMRHFT